MSEGRSRRSWVWGLIVVLGFLAAACIYAMWKVGSWLVVEDPLEPAHAIVVLSGDMPWRATEAARLYKKGYAAHVWISQPISPARELQKLNIFYVGEEFYNEKVLLALGVPSDAIRVLEKPAANTEEEVEEIAAELRQEGGRKAIVVTSKAHTRRVRSVWNHLVGPSPRLIVRYSPEDPFDASHWWRHTRDALEVVREVLGLANAWAGFPVAPAHP